MSTGKTATLNCSCCKSETLFEMVKVERIKNPKDYYEWVSVYECLTCHETIPIGWPDEEGARQGLRY